MKPTFSFLTVLAVAGALVALAVVIRWRVQSPSTASPVGAATVDSSCADTLARMAPDAPAAPSDRH